MDSRHFVPRCGTSRYNPVTDTWLSSCTLYGSANAVREGVEAWFDAGVPTPILVPSSTKGGQMVAIREMFDTFAG